MKKKVYAGISGGIDSAMSVLLLQEEGFEVTGVALLTGTSSETETEHVRRLAGRLRIELIEEDVSVLFDRQVVRPFIRSYMAGETPSPCTVCNPAVKWETLAGIAARRGDTDAMLSTGHYCRVVRGKSGLFHIARGEDRLKDQSYYLWMLRQDILSRMVLPLGDYKKQEVRREMTERGFSDLAVRRESMGLCFLKGKNYGEFLLEQAPEAGLLEGGEITDASGNVLGLHRGYPFYTLAQRKGLGLPDRQLCVTAIDKDRNRLIVGDKNVLFTKTLILRDVRIVDPDELFASDRVSLDVRGVGINPEGYCRVTKMNTGKGLKVTLENPAWAVAKGQPAVFYLGDRVAGGGFVEAVY